MSATPDDLDLDDGPETLKFKKRPDKVKLTHRTLKALPVPPPEPSGSPGRAYTYDVETPRLAVCTFSTGAQTWYWVGRCQGRVIRHKLGEYPEIAPEQAKKLAAKVSLDVANGKDPREERYRSRSEQTLGEFFQVYLDEHARLHKRTWEDDAAQFARYCGSLAPRYLSSVTRAEVAALHVQVGREHGRYAANRLLSLLSKVYAYAEQHGFPRANPCRGIQRFREESRERFLDGGELQRFFAALGEEPQLFQDFFLMLLLTGARRGNVQAMRFEQLDLVARTWRIPTTKNGRPLTVHLTAEALAILQRRLADSQGNPWVFPGGKKNQQKHLTEPKGAWKRICTRAVLDNVRIHDLRRTLGSWQAATGASIPVIGKTLGHLSQSTTQVYARLDLDPVRQSVDTAVAAMMAAAKKPE